MAATPGCDGVESHAAALLHHHATATRPAATAALLCSLETDPPTRLEVHCGDGQVIIDDYFIRPPEITIVRGRGQDAEQEVLITDWPGGGYTFQAQEVMRLRAGDTESPLVPGRDPGPASNPGPVAGMYPGLTALITKLTGTIQPYGWGSRTVIADLLGVPPTGEPQAELWFGAHPLAPSVAAGRPLTELIAEDPDGIVGAAPVAAFGPRLPFLVKIIAADQPLSLQAHPSRAQAEGRLRPGAGGRHPARHPTDLLRRLAEAWCCAPWLRQRPCAGFAIPTRRTYSSSSWELQLLLILSRSWPTVRTTAGPAGPGLRPVAEVVGVGTLCRAGGGGCSARDLLERDRSIGRSRTARRSGALDRAP
jgi:hypothetical protein